jgi:hypothetical protein
VQGFDLQLKRNSNQIKYLLFVSFFLTAALSYAQPNSRTDIEKNVKVQIAIQLIDALEINKTMEEGLQSADSFLTIVPIEKNNLLKNRNQKIYSEARKAYAPQKSRLSKEMKDEMVATMISRFSSAELQYLLNIQSIL